MKKVYTSFFYILFEGLSRGGSTFIFLFAASVLPQERYINLLSLFSLEVLFTIFAPVFYTEVLYKLRDKYSKKEIEKNTFNLSIYYLFILLAVVSAISTILNEYYNTSIIVILLISVNSAFRIMFQNFSVSNQVEENHRQAITDKATPFFFSFIFSLFGFLFFKDKILGFFLGRTIGYSIILMFYIYRNSEILQFTTKPNIAFIKDHLTRTSFLVIKGFSGWILGYGILNILKALYPVAINYKVGLMLNLWTAFLLISNGINSVYLPSFRRNYLKGKSSARNIYRKTFFLYLVLLSGTFVIYLTLKLDFLQFLISKFSLVNYYEIFPYVILIFFAQIFQFVSIPYFLVNDLFRKLAVIIFFTTILSLGLIFIHYYSFNNYHISILAFIVAGYFLRSLTLFIYQKLYI